MEKHDEVLEEAEQMLKDAAWELKYYSDKIQAAKAKKFIAETMISNIKKG